MNGTKIEKPGSLQSAGLGARQLAGKTQSAGQQPVDETSAAAKNFSGGEWHGGLGQALSALAETWSSQCSSLVKRVSGLGFQLERTGTNYSQVETTNTQGMQRLQSERSPFG